MAETATSVSHLEEAYWRFVNTEKSIFGRWTIIWPFDRCFRVAFLAKFLGLPVSAVLLLFHRNFSVVISVGVFYSDCVNPYSGFCIANPLGLEKVPIWSTRGRCTKRSHSTMRDKSTASENSAAPLCSRGSRGGSDRETMCVPRHTLSLCVPCQGTMCVPRQKIQFSRPSIC